MSAAAGAGTRRRRATAHEEEHENHERWLISYADMITLLMALFIVMFAVSQVDQQKFAQLSQGLQASFGAPISTLPGSNGVLDQSGLAPAPIDLRTPSLRPPAAATDPDAEDTADAQDEAGAEANATAPATSPMAEARAEADDLRDIKARIIAALAERGLEDAVRFRVDERGLVVHIVTDSVLFPPDLATLSDSGMEVLDAVAPVLREVPHSLAVEGHTNQAPVSPRFFASEWELSTARATTVVRFLTEQRGIAPDRVHAAGYGDTTPLWPHDDEIGREINRRVEVVVLSRISGAGRALLPEVGADLSDPLLSSATPAAPTTTSP
jgi:chemotaxis protein MotB